MEGLINNYRRSRSVQNNKHMIVSLTDVDNREKALKEIGKKVIFTTVTGNQIFGEIKAAHGNNGCVRVIFSEKGLPGQSIGQKVKVE